MVPGRDNSEVVKLHHVGVAVEDLDAAIELYTTNFGAELTHRATDEKGELKAAFLRAGEAEVELLQPLLEDSPVGKFLARRGPGLHHIAVAVPDIEKAIADARAAGLEMIDQEPRVGLHGTRIAFVHPKSVGGVLTEFVEA
jgi:methylmalonyl-CoA/ethylmalonyl-CoA epimerase